MNHFIDHAGDVTTSSRALIMHCSDSFVILYSSSVRVLSVSFSFSSPDVLISVLFLHSTLDLA